MSDTATVHAITVELDAPVPMRDGTILRADVYRPGTEGRFPVLLLRIPYDRNNTLMPSIMDFRAAARAGYVVVFQDARGRFASEGEWLPWKHEREDGYDTVEWAAALPYSSGRVGMFGPSYMGSTQWSAAIAAPPHLAGIAPITTWSDPEDGLMFRGGAIEFGLNLFWGLLTGMSQLPKAGHPPEEMMDRLLNAMDAADGMVERTCWQLPSGAHPALVSTGQPDIGVTRALQDMSTTEECRVSSRYDEVEVPSLTIAGWYDVFQQGALDTFVGMRARDRAARLVIGPWGHFTLGIATTVVGDVNFGLGSLAPGGQPLPRLHLDWYDHWLKEGPATASHDSGVLLFVMGANTWRHEETWPLERAVATPLHLGADAALTWGQPGEAEAFSEYTYDPADPAMTRGGNLVIGDDFPAGPFDQRDVEARDDVLVFTTAPLEEDTEITGRVTATLFAATDGPSTDWVVRLCEVDAKGVSRNVVDGITRVTTEPGRVDEVTVDLWSTSLLVKAGHRLRVQVTSSNFPRWDRNLNTGEPVTTATEMRVARQRILHDADHPSRLVLPVVPA